MLIAVLTRIITLFDDAPQGFIVTEGDPHSLRERIFRDLTTTC